MSKSILQRVKAGERLTAEEIFEAFERLERLEGVSDEKPKTKPTKNELVAHHLAMLAEGNVYKETVPMLMYRPHTSTLFYCVAEAEHDGVWLIAEKRGGGVRQPNGVSAQAPAERHDAANKAIGELFTYLLQIISKR